MLRKVVFLRALALATILVMLSRLPATSWTGIDTILLYMALTIGSVYLSVLLSQGELSTAYLVGIVATLLLPVDLSMAVTWGIFAGGIIGGLLRAFYRQRRPRYHRTAPIAQSVITLTARITLSYVLAGDVYRALGGQQPLTALDAPSMTPLFGFSLVYLVVYLGIFLLSVHIGNRSAHAALTENGLQIVLTMTVPPPFIILSIIALGPAHSLIGWLLIGELTLFAVGLHWFSQIFYRLHQQSRELSAVANVSRALRANQDVDSLVNVVYRQLADLLFIDYFEAILAEPDDKYLSQRHARNGQPQTTIAFVKRQPGSLTDYVLRSQNPLLIEHDVPNRARQLGLKPPIERFSAWLGVPLLSGRRTLGALVVASCDPGQYFGPDEQHALTIIAAATSTALDNAQLYRQQTVRVSQLGNLNTVLSLLTETLSPDDVLDHVISSASVVAEATAVAVYRYQDDTFKMVRSAGLSAGFVAAPVLAVGSEENHVDGQIVVIQNGATDDRVRHLWPLAQDEAKRAWVELLLAVGGEPVGALILYYDEPRRFESEYLELLRAFANQAAQAIRNADLYAGTYRALETRVEQLSTLAAMGRDLAATMNLRSLCEALLDYALDSTSTHIGAIVLAAQDSQQAEVIASRGYPPAAFNDLAVVGHGITGQVFRGGQAIRCEDLHTSHDYVALNRDTRSQLTVPIIWRNRTLGAITLESEQRAHFDEEACDFVSQLANQAVFALENARLFNDTTEARDQMQAILNTMTEGIILIDRRENIALANPRVTSLLGLQRDLLNEQPLGDVLEKTNLAACMGFESPDEVIHLVRSMHQTSVARHPEIFAYTLSSNRVSTHIHREVIPVHDEQGEIAGVLLVFYDQTEQHNLERAREEFSQMIIHDLRSPLTAITSNVSLLSEVVPADNEFGSLVEQTAGSSQRAIRKLLNRVDSLLEVARLRSGQVALRLEIARLSHLIENVQVELGPLARRQNVQIVSVISHDMPMMIDTEKVERVLLNLVDNALKFSPGQSEIMVRAYRWSNGAANPLLRVDVVDHGPGIPEDERDTIFDRFVQVQQQPSPYRRGSGLGLNFCKMAIEAHDGTIWIEDNPTGGSIFSFTLPIRPGDGDRAS